RHENPGSYHIKSVLTLKGFANRQTLTGFVYLRIFLPKVVAALQPWAEISERLRRYVLLSISGVPRPTLAARSIQVQCPPKQVIEVVVNQRQTGLPAGSGRRHQPRR